MSKLLTRLPLVTIFALLACDMPGCAEIPQTDASSPSAAMQSQPSFFAYDNKSGRKYEVTPDKKSVICTMSGDVLWQRNVLSDDAKMIYQIGDRTYTQTNEIKAIGLAQNGSLWVNIPGGGISCATELDAATGQIAGGGCD